MNSIFNEYTFQVMYMYVNDIFKSTNVMIMLLQWMYTCFDLLKTQITECMYTAWQE